MGRGGFSKKCKLRKLTGRNRSVQGDKEPRHRASPKRIVSLYPHLTPEQRELIKDAGFGGLLKIGCPKLPYGLCSWLLERFDTDYCELVIKGRGRIPITSDSVHRVLGIPNRGGDVKYRLDAGAITFMSDKYDVVNGYSPTLTSIEKSLKQMKSADEHFLRTFMVLVVSSFLCPTTSLRISPWCFPSLVDIGSIRELNWCKFVVEQLKKFVGAYGRKNSVPGCLFYLVILYLDSLDTRDTQIPDGTPRISAWNKQLVDKVIEMDMKNNGSFGKCLTPNSPVAVGSSAGRKTSKRIILACQGATQNSSEIGLVGMGYAPLNMLGTIQSQKTAEVLLDPRVNGILCSRQVAAVDTATAICEVQEAADYLGADCMPRYVEMKKLLEHEIDDAFQIKQKSFGDIVQSGWLGSMEYRTLEGLWAQSKDAWQALVNELPDDSTSDEFLWP